MRPFFRHCLFIGVLIFIFSGCAQVIVPEDCSFGGIMGGSYNGYGGSISIFDEGYVPPLSKLSGNWLYKGDDNNFERIALQNDGVFTLENRIGDQIQTQNGTYRFDSQKLELRINDLYYLFTYKLRTNRLIIGHDDQTTEFLRQNN